MGQQWTWARECGVGAAVSAGSITYACIVSNKYAVYIAHAQMALLHANYSAIHTYKSCIQKYILE